MIVFAIPLGILAGLLATAAILGAGVFIIKQIVRIEERYPNIPEGLIFVAVAVGTFIALASCAAFLSTLWPR